MSAEKGYEQFPTTPSILEELNINTPESAKILARRNTLIESKKVGYDFIFDNSLELRPYQAEDVNFLRQLKAKGVYNQQRTGKTPTTLVTLAVRKEKRNLIVVPKSLVVKWYQEYSKWNGGKAVYMKDSWTKRKRVQMYSELDHDTTIIISYGKLANDIEDIKKHVKYFDAVVLDEAHRLKNFKGMRSKSSPTFAKAVMYAGRMAKGRYALTGTPSPNYAWNIFGILHFLYPSLFKSYYRFIDYYFKTDTTFLYRGGTRVEFSEPTGFKNPLKERELAEFLQMTSTQRKRADVMPWLPEADLDIVHLDMLPKQKKHYVELFTDMETDDIITQGTLDTMTRLRQITLDPRLLGLNVEGTKTRYIRDYIHDNPDKPILIVSAFTSYLQLLAEEFKAPIMHGGTSDKNRDRLEREFQEGKFPILLGNITVIKEGFTLSRAETIIFADESYIYEDNNQTADRILPTTPEQAEAKEGQTIIKLMANQSFDFHMSTLLKGKKSSVSIVNDYLKYLKARRNR